MRYQKGSIGLNDRKDKAILTLVADSRYVTHSQLFGLASTDFGESNRRVFNWRIRRLVQHGLVRRQILPYLNGEALYSINRAGVQALEQLSVYYLGANLDREKDPSELQIPHALELNNIRLALASTYLLLKWIPESFIRVLNLSPAHSYAKVYDGIASVCLPTTPVDFAIEYERTLKSQSKYDKVREAIESEKRLEAFLYLVPTYHVLWALSHEFRGTRRCVLFGLVNQFKERALDATVRSPSYHESSLRDALMAVAGRARS